MIEREEAWKPILIDLKNWVLHVELEQSGIQLRAHFDTQARRFYLAVIALVVNEMKKKGEIKGVKIKPFYNLLLLFNNVLSEKAGSEEKGKLIGRIYRKWRYVLPELDKGSLFVLMGRDRIESKITKTKLYECTREESITWKSLFTFKGKETEVRLCFSIDSLGLDLDDVVIEYGEEKDAWEMFINDLKSKKEITSPTSQDSHDDKKIILDQYLDQVEKDYRYLDTKHLPILPLPDNAIELHRVYIRLRATDVVPHSEAMYLTEYTKDISGIPDRFIEEKNILPKKGHGSLPINQVLQKTVNEPDTLKKHMVFLGTPGSGKTTLLRYLAYILVSGKSKDQALETFIPFYIELGDYSRNGSKDLMQYILDKAVDNIAGVEQKNFIKEVLGNFINECNKTSQEYGQLIFLMDALDETRDKKEKVVNQIESFRNRYSNVFIIVTSRITGYYDAPLRAFDPYLIEDLKITEIHDFISNVFAIIGEEKTKKNPEVNWNYWVKDRTDYLKKEIDNKHALRRIATTPLYLTFLVFLASDPDTILPKTRCELYDLYFQKLLYKWEDKYEEPLPLNERDLFEGFKEISWIIHRSLFGDIYNDPTDVFIKDSIKNLFTIDIDKLLNFWVKAGIFQRVQTRSSKELILPRHIGFLEYGFAWKLADLWNNKETIQDCMESLESNLHNRHLYEPLLLFVGKLKDPLVFLKKVLSLKDDIVCSNLIILFECAKELIDDLKKKEILASLLSKLLNLYRSQNHLIEPIKSKIVYYLTDQKDITNIKKLYEGEIDHDNKAKMANLICNMADKTAIPLLKELIEKEKDSGLRFVFSYAISELGDESPNLFLKDYVYEEQNSSARMDIIHLISRKSDKRTLFLLKALYDKEEDLYLRNAIIDPIGRIIDEDTFLILKESYEKESNSHIREKIIKYMCVLGDKRSISFLMAHLNKEEDITLREVIVYAIGKLGGESSMSFLKGLFYKEKSIGTKLSIINCLIEQDKKAIAISLLGEIYNNENSAISKVDVAIRLYKLGENIYWDYIKLIYSGVKEGVIRNNLVSNIAVGLGHSMSIPFLKELLKVETDPVIQRNIMLWIARFGDKEIKVSLFRLLEDEMDSLDEIDPFIAYDIAEMIDAKNDKAYLPFVIKLLNRVKESGARESIVRILGDIGDKSVVSFLKKMSHKEKDIWVRIEIAKSLFRLGERKMFLLVLKQLLGKVVHSSVGNRVAFELYNMARGSVLIHKNKENVWEIIDIRERYSF